MSLNHSSMSKIQVPDSIWLYIFSFIVDPRDLARLSKVSRHWFDLSRDRTLWRRLTFGTVVPLKKLSMFVRRPVAQHLVSLRVEGELKSRKRPLSSRQTVSTVLLDELAHNCARLKELHIEHADLSKLSVTSVPPTVTFLGVPHCVIPFHFLQPLNDASLLSNLTGLDLSYCHKLASVSHSIAALFTRKNLTHLNLRHCYKVTNSHLCELPTQLPNLTFLDLSDLNLVDDQVLLNIARHSLHLVTLNLSSDRSITDVGIGRLASLNCHKLKKLLLDDTPITDISLKSLASRTSLKYLSVVKTKCTKDGVRSLKSSLIACRVDHKVTEANHIVGETFWWISGAEEEEAVN